MTTTNEPMRGERVTNGAGAQGLFVGRDERGLVWIAWEAEAFERMCAQFDATTKGG